jgi:CelD/BcsL family acetyltransferase involved in cellulose biosynthesis
MSHISSFLHPRERMPVPEAPAARLKAVAGAHSTPGSWQRAAPAVNGKAPGNISLEVRSDLAAMAAEWKAFEPVADCTPFQTFAWLDHWQRHIGARKGTLPVIVFGHDDNGEILFILPLAIDTQAALRRLTWLGMELGDYNAPLLAQRFSGHPVAEDFPSVWNAVVALLQSNARYHFDLVDLPKMPETVGAQKNPFLQLSVLPNRSGAYLTTLGDNWEQYYAAKRSASTRKTARRKQKQLEGYGKLNFINDVPLEASAQTLDTLIEQKSGLLGRMGVENIFQRAGYPEFYRALATDPEARRDFVHVSRLDVGDVIGATNLALRFRERYYLILSSYYGGEMSRSGPGTAHLHELLRLAIARGFRYFDFTIGDETYKLDWSDTKLVLYDHLAPHSARGWLVASAIMLARRATRKIKQTPWMWRIAVKVRALLARGKQKPAEAADEAE